MLLCTLAFAFGALTGPTVSCKREPMAKHEYSQYQKGVIEGYYNNLDTIMLQKLSELVSELYVAETPSTRSMPSRPARAGVPSAVEGPRRSNPKQEKLWQRAYKAMIKLKIPPAIIDHIMQKRDVQILAKNLQDWLGKAGKK